MDQLYIRLEYNRDSSFHLHVVTVPGLQALSVEILDRILASTKLTDQRSTREAEKGAQKSTISPFLIYTT